MLFCRGGACPSRPYMQRVLALLWGVWANVLFAPPALICSASLRCFGACGQTSCLPLPPLYAARPCAALGRVGKRPVCPSRRLILWHKSSGTGKPVPYGIICELFQQFLSRRAENLHALYYLLVSRSGIVQAERMRNRVLVSEERISRDYRDLALNSALAE